MTRICHGVSYKYIIAVPPYVVFHVEQETVDKLNRSYERIDARCHGNTSGLLITGDVQNLFDIPKGSGFH